MSELFVLFAYQFTQVNFYILKFAAFERTKITFLSSKLINYRLD